MHFWIHNWWQVEYQKSHTVCLFFSSAFLLLFVLIYFSFVAVANEHFFFFFSSTKRNGNWKEKVKTHFDEWKYSTYYWRVIFFPKIFIRITALSTHIIIVIVCCVFDVRLCNWMNNNNPRSYRRLIKSNWKILLATVQLRSLLCPRCWQENLLRSVWKWIFWWNVVCCGNHEIWKKKHINPWIVVWRCACLIVCVCVRWAKIASGCNNNNKRKIHIIIIWGVVDSPLALQLLQLLVNDYCCLNQLVNLSNGFFFRGFRRFAEANALLQFNEPIEIIVRSHIHTVRRFAPFEFEWIGIAIDTVMVNDKHSVFVRDRQQREMHNYEIITKLTTLRGQPLNSEHSCVANQTMFRMHFKLEWNWHSFICIELSMRLNCCVTPFGSPKSNVNGQHL